MPGVEIIFLEKLFNHEREFVGICHALLFFRLTAGSRLTFKQIILWEIYLETNLVSIIIFFPKTFYA